MVSGVGASLGKGSPVIVVGHVHTSEYEDRDGVRRSNLEMRAGSVMFLPRGHWHDCETTDHESIHFNIQLGLPTWKDLLAFGAKQALDAAPVEIRAGVAHAFSQGVLVPEHRQTLMSMITRWFGQLSEDKLAFKESEFDEFGSRLRGTLSRR